MATATTSGNTTRSKVTLEAAGRFTHIGRSSEQMMAVLSAQYSPDGALFAAATAKGTVYMFDTAAKESMTTVGHGHAWAFNPSGLGDASATSCIRFAPKSASSDSAEYLAATTLSTGNVALWTLNSSTHKAEQVASVSEVGNQTLSVAFSPDGTSLVTGGNDKVLRRYALNLCGAEQEQGTEGPATPLQLVAEYKAGLDEHGQDTLGPNNRVFCVKFLDNDRFLTGGWESPVLLYDQRHGERPYAALHGVHVGGDSIDVTDSVVVVGSERQKDQIQYFDLRKVGRGATPAPGSDPALMAQVTLPGRVFTARFARSPIAGERPQIEGRHATWAGMADVNGLSLVTAEAPGRDGTLAFFPADEPVFCAEQNPAVLEYMTIAGGRGLLEHIHFRLTP